MGTAPRSAGVAVVVLACAWLDALRAGAPALSAGDMARAVALGRRCTAPIVRVRARPGQDFDVYVESPLGRAALAVATATVMHYPIDAVPVKRTMTEASDYRVWGDYVPSSRGAVSVRRVMLQPVQGPAIAPIRQMYERFFVGRVPSHGIIEPLRARFGEAVFDRLPDVDYDVVFQTTGGVQRYRVTREAREALLHVCN
jgi:hypothetical protein